MSATSDQHVVDPETASGRSGRVVVNGESHELGPTGGTLLDLLRGRLGLYGARAGCGVAACGVCTVLLDGRPERACQLPLTSVEGREVVTPEGLGTPDDPHPVQQAFLHEQAAQCGFCTNGMIMTVAGLKDDEDAATTIPAALDEHLCRCYAHARIERAVARVLGADVPDPGWRFVEPGDGADGADDRHDPFAVVEVGDRVELRPDGRFAIRVGKVELGQGITTALRQVAAAQLATSVERVVAEPVVTAASPDEGGTTGSQSLEKAGRAVAEAAAGFRQLLLERAAGELGVVVDEVELRDGEVVTADGATRLSLVDLARRGPIAGDTSAAVTWDVEPIGRPVPRADLVPKLTGSAAFVHDVVLPGMVYARALLPPTYDARLVGIDPDAVRAWPEVVDVLLDERLVVVVAESDGVARAAVDALARSAEWDAPQGQVGPMPRGFRDIPVDDHLTVRDDVAAEACVDGTTRSATYEAPYQSHATIAPACAVVEVDDDRTTVLAHTQNPYRLRSEIAGLLERDVEKVHVEYADGPGCYGQSLADDAAGFAAIAARAVPGRPVRFQFTSQDEFAWDAHGPAGLVDVSATLGPDGGLRSWDHRVLSDAHGTRVRGRGQDLMAAWLASGPAQRYWPGAKEAGARNAVPPYRIPQVTARHDAVRGPLRTGSLRTLGSFLNVFAVESFVDELAEQAGQDPVRFRLDHLDDPRARHVLATAADAIGYRDHVGPSGRGIGIAYARYKGDKAHVAQAVEVAVDRETFDVAVVRVVTVCDAGRIVNPDGLANQLDGGTLQGVSRTLHEQAVPGRTGDGWLGYPVLRAAAVPSLDTILVSSCGRPLGAGEASTPAVAPAIANAVDDAIGVRLRSLPIDAASLMRRLYELEGADAERVLT